MLLDDLRREILTSGKSYRQLEEETGIDNARLNKFVHGSIRLNQEQIEALVELFGLRLKKEKKQ